MKNFVYGFISCLLLVVLLLAIPAVADGLGITLGGIRINIDGVDQAQWEEQFELSDGRTVPYSISYQDTTYLPLRKISELLSKTVYWNGDSHTVSITDSAVDSSIYEIAEKPDANGNVWKYYTFANRRGDRFLGMKDEKRGYERVYQIIGSTRDETKKDSLCVWVDEEGIYFVKVLPRIGNEPYTTSELYKINFLSDENSQDGEEVTRLNDNSKLSVMFIDNCLYYYATNPGSLANRAMLHLLSLEDYTTDSLFISMTTSKSGIEGIKTEEDGTTYLYYYREDSTHRYHYRVKAIMEPEVKWAKPELLNTEEKDAE